MTAQHIDDYFRHELIYKRNLRMAERVDQLLKSQPDRSFFFAFGAGKFKMLFYKKTEIDKTCRLLPLDNMLHA